MTFTTNVNTAKKTMGFRIDQIAPRIDALYLTFSSLRMRFSRISRWAYSSRMRATGRSESDSDVRSVTLSAVAMSGLLGWMRRSDAVRSSLATGDPATREVL